MAHRHDVAKKGGGGIGKAALSFGNKDVVKEAKKRNSGGEVGKILGKAAGGRLDRKRGGKIMSPGCASNPWSSAKKG